jgi:hypothetical protein
MSTELYAFAEQFAIGQIPADNFADEFITRWKEERDAGMLTKDTPEASERLSSIFCVADLYNPDPDRKDYELDELQLRERVKTLMGL